MTINAAMSADGKIATADRRQTRLSGEADIARMHRLRASHDAVLVGIGTILADDPKLTVKWEVAGLPAGEQPLRVVLDSRGRTPDTAAVLAPLGRTLICTNEACVRAWKAAEVFRRGTDRVDVKGVLEDLSRRGVRSLLVEGGSEVIWSFLHGGFADELKVYVGSVVLGGAQAPTLAGGDGVRELEEAVKLRLEGVSTVDGGVLLEYRVVP